MDIDFDPVKLKNQLRNKLNEYKRVLKISKKPDREEFEMSAKITGAGIVLIGIIGFVFYLLSNLIPQYL
ncbi:MAG: protein translocase SEC61 complex subunit gamma [Candidatus Nanohaloarchaea archaeon]